MMCDYENKLIEVIRKDGSRRNVRIMKDENTNKYCFVNLTTFHVCPCRFDSVDDAMKDLMNNDFVSEWHLLETNMDAISKAYMIVEINDYIIAQKQTLKEISEIVIANYDLTPLMATIEVVSRQITFYNDKVKFYEGYLQNVETIIDSLKNKPDAQNSTALLSMQERKETIKNAINVLNDIHSHRG